MKNATILAYTGVKSDDGRISRTEIHLTEGVTRTYEAVEFERDEDSNMDEGVRFDTTFSFVYHGDMVTEHIRRVWCDSLYRHQRDIYLQAPIDSDDGSTLGWVEGEVTTTRTEIRVKAL